MHFPSIKKDKQSKKKSKQEIELGNAIALISGHMLFGNLPNRVEFRKAKTADTFACVNRDGLITLNVSANLSANEWVYVIAHCALHNAFGHFDKEKLPDDLEFDKRLWNHACDIYITRFLAELKFGQAMYQVTDDYLPNWAITEVQIYQYLKERTENVERIHCGMMPPNQMDMDGLDKPIVYDKADKNPFTTAYSTALKWAVNHAIDPTSGTQNRWQKKSTAQQAANWFIDHYPLLGGVASSFRLIEDNEYCVTHQIQVAAINTDKREIYVNPAMKLTEQEWRFILAHEYLHAGLCHAQRCQNRDFQIWNIACDFVINSWLVEMQIGMMPTVGLLYDESLNGLSAESIYDMLAQNIRKAKKLDTFRGYGLGDMIASDKQYERDYTTFDDVLREALAQGLEYHQSQGRGLLPAGLVEEIRALSMSPVPWDVKLACWFQEYLPLPEKVRSYARPSRRQGVTPDIPRPRYARKEELENSRTFGVILDTSGSMNYELLAKALGTIASYAEAREVQYIRVVFCDAVAYDAGYMTIEELAGRVEVRGRGGTRLQPAIDLLEEAKDFPKDGPILIITDGYIESRVNIHRTHAWLLPQGNRLPFQSKEEIFYYS